MIYSVANETVKVVDKRALRNLHCTFIQQEIVKVIQSTVSIVTTEYVKLLLVNTSDVAETRRGWFASFVIDRNPLRFIDLKFIEI